LFCGVELKTRLRRTGRKRNIFMMKRDLLKATISQPTQPFAAHVFGTGGLLLSVLRSFDLMKT
jgi:hypothetical protein